jgi:beta-N-acetylhexosaminidase
MKLILFLLTLFSGFLTNLYAKPTLDEKIGQMLMVGFEGYELNEELKTFINKYKVGGLVFVSTGVNKNRIPNIKDPKQIEKLVIDIKKINPTLFIALDQEGGKVARLRARNGFEDTLSHEKLGFMIDKEVYKQSVDLARLVHKYGFNYNFAPVVDVKRDGNPVISGLQRAFSDNVESIYELAKVYIKGQNDVGVITSVKHFPGHGSSTEDTHLKMVDVSATWSEDELIPYERLIKDGYNDSIMIAHVFNKNIDDKYPASLSKKTITDLLRNKMGYNGVIITDSLDMRAISDEYGFKDMVINAINAGNDILMYVNNIDKPYDEKAVENIFNIIKTAIKNGEISEQRINESYERIIALKKRYKIIG